MSSAAISQTRLPAWLMRTLVILFLLGIWEAGSQYGYINAFTAPPPSAIFFAFIRLVQAGDITRWITTHSYRATRYVRAANQNRAFTRGVATTRLADAMDGVVQRAVAA